MKNAVNVKDFTAKIAHQSQHKKSICRLAEQAKPFCLEGGFSGPMLVQMQSALANGTDLLLRYDPEQQKAVLASGYLVGCCIVVLL